MQSLKRIEHMGQIISVCMLTNKAAVKDIYLLKREKNMI